MPVAAVPAAGAGFLTALSLPAPFPPTLVHTSSSRGSSAAVSKSAMVKEPFGVKGVAASARGCCGWGSTWVTALASSSAECPLGPFARPFSLGTPAAAFLAFFFAALDLDLDVGVGVTGVGSSSFAETSGSEMLGGASSTTAGIEDVAGVGRVFVGFFFCFFFCDDLVLAGGGADCDWLLPGPDRT